MECKDLRTDTDEVVNGLRMGADTVCNARSLHVFISKLRDKLVPDASLRLLNVHGQGYKLAIDSVN